MGLVTMSVNGMRQVLEMSDLHRFVTNAATEIRTELTIKPESGGHPARVVVYSLYYPFKEEKETLPMLNAENIDESASGKGCRDEYGKSRATSRTAAAARGPGGALRGHNPNGAPTDGGGLHDNLCQVFWMGRLLPRGLGGRDESLKCLKPRRVSCYLRSGYLNRGILTQCFGRRNRRTWALSPKERGEESAT